MYRRPRSNANTVLPTSNGYRPSYPTPPSYASGLSPASPSEKRKSRKSGNPLLPWWITYLVIGLLFLTCMYFRFQYGQAKQEVADFKTRSMDDRYRREYDRGRGRRDDTRDDMKVMKSRLVKTERELNLSKKSEDELRIEVEKLEHERKDLSDEVAHVRSKISDVKDVGNGGAGTSESELKRLEKREEALYTRISSLQVKIKRESHREVIERFGEGPHYVQFDVKMPRTDEQKSFVVETASIKLMPHSVHLFLEQVKHGLWNGCAFVINAAHILQAGPHALDGLEDKLQPFKNMELDVLSFPEYSPEYTHNKFTLGFAGRPGGPDFYINKINNTLNHGPGGQEHHVLDNEADPCFAKVVDGITSVEELFKLPAGGSHNLLQHAAEIVKASLLSDSYVPPGGNPNSGTSTNTPEESSEGASVDSEAKVKVN